MNAIIELIDISPADIRRLLDLVEYNDSLRDLLSRRDAKSPSASASDETTDQVKSDVRTKPIEHSDRVFVHADAGASVDVEAVFREHLEHTLQVYRRSRRAGRITDRVEIAASLCYAAEAMLYGGDAAKRLLGALKLDGDAGQAFLDAFDAARGRVIASVSTRPQEDLGEADDDVSSTRFDDALKAMSDDDAGVLRRLMRQYPIREFVATIVRMQIADESPIGRCGTSKPVDILP